MTLTASLPKSAPRQRPRSLAHTVVEGLADGICSGQWPPGAKLPSESAIMGDYGVSRTVVREALSKLQAAGLVSTRHGVGTFVETPPLANPGDGAGFRIDPAGQATLRDVVAVLELRIGVETEAAGLAAQRRSDANLLAMRQALDAMAVALVAGDSAVAADFQFHFEITRATQNAHFSHLMAALGPSVIPRGRLLDATPVDADHLAYLRRVQAEHESILDAIAAQDADAARAAMRIHLINSRERRRRAAASAARAAELAGSS